MRNIVICLLSISIAGCLDAQPARTSPADFLGEDGEAIANRDPDVCLCPPGWRCDGRECIYDEDVSARGDDPGDTHPEETGPECLTDSDCHEGFYCHERSRCYFSGECVRDEQCLSGRLCIGFFCECVDEDACLSGDDAGGDDAGIDGPTPPEGGSEDPSPSEGEGENPLPHEGEGENPLPHEGEGEGEIPNPSEGEGEVHCEPFDEVCNNVDDDCDGRTDEELPALLCGVGLCTRTIASCVAGVPQQCVPGDPVEESCNGLDDDCDGRTDEELAELECGVGACQRSVFACIEGVPQQCVPSDPVEESCNGLDDDCDGLVDEDLGTISCGQGPCEVSVPACVDGEPQECSPGDAGLESCNGLDDDCDGLVDEGDPQGGDDCDTGALGMCSLGRTRCLNGELACEHIKRPSDELCNGLDDDCDGLVDEELGELVCGLGECSQSVAACSEGIPQECVAGQPSDELCNGLDDDCDGRTDEDYPEFAQECDTGGLGACQPGFLFCAGAQLHCVERSPARAERCNGRDDDCDGETDEGFRDLTCGVGACRRVVAACVAGEEQECIPGDPQEELCDSPETIRIDDDCDGDVDNFEGCLRLVGGDDPLSGRLEIYHSGEWGTICDDAWTARDDPFENANVACRQLGFIRAFDALGQDESPYGPGDGRIWMDNVQCTGEEEWLSDCTFPEEELQEFGVHNCNHNEDVALICE